VLPTIAHALGFDMQGGYLPGVSLLKDVRADRTLYYGSWEEEFGVGNELCVFRSHLGADSGGTWALIPA